MTKTTISERIDSLRADAHFLVTRQSNLLSRSTCLVMDIRREAARSHVDSAMLYRLSAELNQVQEAQEATYRLRQEKLAEIDRLVCEAESEYEPVILTGFTVEYAGYIVDGEEFKTLAEADAYMVENSLMLPEDERYAYDLCEWPDGTWLRINAERFIDVRDEDDDEQMHRIEPEADFVIEDFEVVSKAEILAMDCNYNIEGERAYRLLRDADSCIISFAHGEWCAEYIHWYYDANGEKVEDYLEDFFGDAPYEVCDKASAYAVTVAELIKAEWRD